MNQIGQEIVMAIIAAMTEEEWIIGKIVIEDLPMKTIIESRRLNHGRYYLFRESAYRL